MPIRWRCEHCKQLIGIARRKAGAVVHCPTCAQALVVPTPEDDSPPAAEEVPQRVFERSDFDEVFQPPLRHRSLVHAPEMERKPAHPGESEQFRRATEPDIDVDAPAPPLVAPTASPAGVWLSSKQVTILSVLLIAALALAFVAGLWVGLSFPRGDRAAQPVREDSQSSGRSSRVVSSPAQRTLSLPARPIFNSMLVAALRIQPSAAGGTCT